MNFDQFDTFQKELFEEVVKMRDTKGKEYCNNKNRFANFEDEAKELGVSDLTIAMIFCDKHIRSIKQAIRTGQFTGRAEALRGRFIDVINYMSFMAGMVEERVHEETITNYTNLELLQTMAPQPISNKSITYQCVNCLLVFNNILECGSCSSNVIGLHTFKIINT